MQRALTIIVFCVAALAAENEAPTHLTQAQATKDIRTFLSLLESTHPDPYSNMGGKINFKRTAQTLVHDIPADGLSVPELTERLGTFLAPLKDGHTRVRGSRSRWQDPAPRLAVEFDIASDGLLIESSDLAELKGTCGYRLIAVEGHMIDELLKQISVQLAAENEYGSYVGLTIALRSYKLLQNLIPGLNRASGVLYTLRDPDGAKVERRIRWEGEHPEDPEKWSDKAPSWAGMEHSDQPFYYRFLADGHTAYFRIANMNPREVYDVMKGYTVGDPKESLQQYYKAHHKEMPADIDTAIRGVPSLLESGTQMLEEMKRRNTPNLVIDLRDDGGGSTPVIVPFFYRLYGDAYFGRPSDAEFVQVKSQLYLEKYHSSVEEERKKNPAFELGDYEFTSGDEPGTAEEKRNKKFAEWNERGIPWAHPLEELHGKPLYRPAKVIVLCSPGTFSAAFQAMFALHQMGAIVVGVPSAQSPNAFMEGTPFVLPESGIQGQISNGTQMYLPKDPRANVFHPDFESSYSVVAKYGAAPDADLRYALDLLAEGKI
jgi:Peptidase family S41